MANSEVIKWLWKRVYRRKKLFGLSPVIVKGLKIKKKLKTVLVIAWLRNEEIKNIHMVSQHKGGVRLLCVSVSTSSHVDVNIFTLNCDWLLSL